jgi:hypothetical protein
MTEWFYKATPARVSFEETRDLALNDGFICRSAFEDNTSRADNTQHVQFRDIIHMYFTGDGPPKVIGTFEVVGPRRHPKANCFAEAVQGTVLFVVTDEFAKKLTAMGDGEGCGYKPDPVLKKVIGWAVIARTDIATPTLAAAPFKNQATLARGDFR